MSESRRSGYESLSIGVLFIAFAVALLIAWVAADWWLFIPIFMLEVGAFYFVLGVVMRPQEVGRRHALKDASYYVFWGATLVVISLVWLLNRQYPGNLPLLVALFIIWIGVVVVVLSLPRFRQGAQAPPQQEPPITTP